MSSTVEGIDKQGRQYGGKRLRTYEDCVAADQDTAVKVAQFSETAELIATVEEYEAKAATVDVEADTRRLLERVAEAGRAELDKRLIKGGGQQ